MEDFQRSKSYANGQMMQIESYYGPPRPYDLRSYSSSYVQQPPKDLKLKKGKSFSAGSSFSKSLSLADPELQRKKRVASYKMYTVEASFAATIAIITALCGDRFRRKSQPVPPKVDPADVSKVLKESSVTSYAVATKNSSQHEQENSAPNEKPEQKTETDNNEFMVKELPLPPSMLQPKEPFSGNHMKRVTSERRASFSLSLKMPMPRSLSLARKMDHLKEEKIKPKLKTTEDSVWMKTIILGEKCVPDEEDDPIIFEGKGKKIAAYHPKSSMSISRQSSFQERDALDVSQSQSQTQEKRINNI